MPRSILVGLDVSSYAAAAVELWIEWARRFDAVLVGLGIIDQPTICKPEPVSVGGMAYKEPRDQSLLADARRTVERLLEGFSLRCAEAGVSSKVLEDVGLPAEQIMLEAQRYDLILLGQQTYFHFETQARADETLRNVVKHCPRPVVAVPDQPRGGKALVVAYDGSLQAARTLQAFQGVGLDGSQDVHIVSVDADHAQAARHADRALEFLRFHGTTAFAHPVATTDPPAEVILEHLQRLDAGMLVMGAYGRPVLKEFFFGSVTRSVLAKYTVPLFLYH